MKRIFLLTFVTVCFVKTCLPSGLNPKEGLCFVAVIIVRGSALPAYFYDLMEDLEDVDLKQEVFMTVRNHVFKPTTTTTEAPIVDEWKQRGEYRIQCIDEVPVAPSKVVRLLSTGEWNNSDLYLKKWTLCVLNKMNLMSMEGVFKMDVALSKLYNKEKPAAELLIDTCLPKMPMKPYEISWKYVKCHYSGQGNHSLAAISVF